jgi:hypothetical protein
VADSLLRVVDVQCRCGAGLDMDRRERHGPFLRPSRAGCPPDRTRRRADNSGGAGTSARQSAPALIDTAAAQPYRTIAITSPVQQETLWNTAGILNVEIDLAPALRPGHVLDVYLDGERRNLNATSTRFTLPEVWRGVHTLQAIVLDASGRELTRSLAVTFMVQQTSIQNPNNPNVPRLAPPQSLPGR